MKLFKLSIGNRGCSIGYRAWIRCIECDGGNLYDAGEDINDELRFVNAHTIKECLHSDKCETNKIIQSNFGLVKESIVKINKTVAEIRNRYK